MDVWDQLAHLGMGGTIAVLLVREVLRFVNGSNPKPKHWQGEMRRTMEEALQPLINDQRTEIELLRDIKSASEDTRGSMIEILALVRRWTK